MTDTDKNCPHCGTHIDEHPASRCLRGWVASSVMGWEVIDGKDGLPAHTLTDKGEHYYLLPDLGPMWYPDFDIAVAWEVLEKIAPATVEDVGECWHVYRSNLKGHRGYYGEGETAPLAICKAALFAVQQE